MGKKKAIRSTAGKQTGNTKAKPSFSTAGSSRTRAAVKKKEAGNGSTHPAAISPIEIGQTAGEIWRVLAEEGEQSLSALKKKVTAPNDQILAAVGWLAREGKLQFESKGRSIQISLR